ncbi:MAG: PPC domain-containing protein [Deltaproteobacteria bacterium]|nr:PPC domain-containing protein [Deltaproteobacteria bacterium]
MKRLASYLATAALAVPAFAACTTEDDLYDGESVKSEDGKADASDLAVFLDVQFEGKLVVDFSFNDRSTIQDQLLYTVGQLNGMNSVGRVDKAQISNIKKTASGGKTTLTYTAVLPVAWGKKNAIPTGVDLQLPLDMSSAGQKAFADKYAHDCVDVGAHDVDAGSMFYYYRPKASRCRIAAEDVHTVRGSVSPSPTQSVGKFPEYDKVWEDNRLEVVAIFGKYEDGATTSADAGIAAYNEFAGLMKKELAGTNLVTVPATIPSNPGVAAPTLEYTATRPDGKVVHVVAMLSDNVNSGLQQSAFRSRYEQLSSRADFIVYNGHAGLGTNVRALAQAGKWVAGQYVVVFMNGCDTFAYIDGALNQAHKAVNPDDTTGSKYIDIVNNAMPAFFSNMAGSTMAMFRGLMSFDAPKTYEQIFRSISATQVVMVTGEEDNKFVPGGGGQPTAWAGITDHGALKRDESKTFVTPTLAPGAYEFAMTGDNDADLYVRIGAAPTTTTFDCRPYKTGSNEVCRVDLTAPAPIHVMVRGYKNATSTYDLVGKKL